MEFICWGLLFICWGLRTQYCRGAVSGDSGGVHIFAVFVSKSAGETILSFADDDNTSCYIRRSFENTAWSVMAVSFISLLAISAVLATFFFVRRHRLRHLGNRLILPREPLGMSSTQVKALPSIVFKCVGDKNGTAETCAICLEDYEIGDKLRVLPCRHGKIMSVPKNWKRVLDIFLSSGMLSHHNEKLFYANRLEAFSPCALGLAEQGPVILFGGSHRQVMACLS